MTSFPSPPLLPTDQDLSLALSPSKALAHHRTATAWSRITTWLTSLFSPSPIPPCERNTATLTSLQSLVDANIRADHGQRLLHDARVEQLRRYEVHDTASTQSPERVLLRDIKDSLGQETRERLEGMARVSVVLGFMPPQDCLSEAGDDVTTVLGKRIIELSQELFRLQSEVEELASLKQKFEEERKTIEEAVVKLREDAAAVEDDDVDPEATGPSSGSASPKIPLDTLLAQTSQFNTSTKQLTLKIKEYQARIDGLRRTLEVQRHDEDDISIGYVQHRQEAVQRKREEMEKLEVKLREFNGLPPDVEASREEVRRAQGELEEWRRRREAAFETIGGG